jgi:hypothetical protein
MVPVSVRATDPPSHITSPCSCGATVTTEPDATLTFGWLRSSTVV